ncbi:MAG: hypothetical protein ACTSWA_08590 [Candidatus Thorarchaeota archaeon]
MMQTDVFDFMALLGFFGFIISVILAIVNVLEYRTKSEQHKPTLKLSWFNLPPTIPQAGNESSICVENIGTKEAHILDVRIKLSYDDNPIIIPSGLEKIVDPGLTQCFSFNFVNPPVGKHEIIGTVVVKHGSFRNRKRSYSITCAYVKR